MIINNEKDDKNMSNVASGATVDPDEVAFFAAIADSWWDPHGPFKPLHKLNPTRLKYIRETMCEHFSLDQKSIKPFGGLRILDIGCGGGLISEPMTRLGANMVSVDASMKNIRVASLHAEQSNLKIDYRNVTAESLVEDGEKFDAIINMEVIEHVADVRAYLSACRSLLKDDGIMLVSTLNRTAKSWLFAIVGAEHVLRWLPVGAHDWNKFMSPVELTTAIETAGFKGDYLTGFSFAPFSGKWSLSERDTDVNYAMAALPI